MFGKESEIQSENSKLSTIIAKGTKIVGNIDMEGSIRIDGYVKGRVSSSETLTVGKTGVVDGEVQVKEAVVGGQVKGNLIVSQRVELENKASIQGDVKTRIFVIKEGGIFHGSCSMQEEKKGEEKGKGKELFPKEEKKLEPPVPKPESSKPLGTSPSLGKI